MNLQDHHHSVHTVGLNAYKLINIVEIVEKKETMLLLLYSSNEFSILIIKFIKGSKPNLKLITLFHFKIKAIFAFLHTL
jgi:hypothetical protein